MNVSRIVELVTASVPSEAVSLALMSVLVRALMSNIALLSAGSQVSRMPAEAALASSASTETPNRNTPVQSSATIASRRLPNSAILAASAGRARAADLICFWKKPTESSASRAASFFFSGVASASSR